MKKPTSKADIRETLQAQMDQFLQDGGSVNKIGQGISGQNPGDPPVFLNRRLFIEPKEKRTLVPEVVAAIEARRKEKFARKPARKGRRAQPRRKTIYDDFGEPLRRVWTDD
ncbi:MAG: hypothetical protein AB8C02_06620 [Halioglobus sp.]